MASWTTGCELVMYNTDSLGGREKAQGELRFLGDMARTWLHLAFFGVWRDHPYSRLSARARYLVVGGYLRGFALFAEGSSAA